MNERDMNAHIGEGVAKAVSARLDKAHWEQVAELRHQLAEVQAERDVKEIARREWAIRAEAAEAELTITKHRLDEAEEKLAPFIAWHSYDENKTGWDHIEEIEAELTTLREWREAVRDAGVVYWTLSEANFDNPRKAIADLIDQVISEQFDPAISEKGRELVTLRALVAEAINIVAEWVPLVRRVTDWLPEPEKR